MIKPLLAVMFMALFVNTVYAECEGDLSIVDLQPQDVGDTAPIVAYTTIFEVGGVRNWDLWVSDPQNNTVVVENRRVDAGTYTLAGSMYVSGDFVDGTYTIRSRLRVLNASDLEEVLCEEAASKEFRIRSNRTKWNQQTLVLQLLPKYMVFREEGLSFDLFLRAWDGNQTEAGNITLSQDACFNVSSKLKCENDLLDKDRLIEKCNTNVFLQMQNLTATLGSQERCDAEKENLTQQSQDKDAYIGGLMGRMGNLESLVRKTTDDIVNCTAQKTACESGRDNLSVLNLNLWVGLGIGGLLLILVLWRVGSVKHGERREG